MQIALPLPTSGPEHGPRFSSQSPWSDELLGKKCHPLSFKYYCSNKTMKWDSYTLAKGHFYLGTLGNLSISSFVKGVVFMPLPLGDKMLVLSRVYQVL